jgi:hypothetical protein
MGIMTRVKRQIIVITILILFLLILWNYREQEYNPGQSGDMVTPGVEISTLPDEVYKSIKDIEKKALDLQKDIKQSTGLRVNAISFSTNQYIDQQIPLVLEVYYIGSNRLLQEVTLMPEAFTGLSVNELKNIAGDWEVKNYRPGKALTLYKKIDDLSPEDKEKLHLGIKDGKVAIFYGDPGSGYLKKMTGIIVEELPIEEQKNLEKGITVNSREELYSILDGLISTINQD